MNVTLPGGEEILLTRRHFLYGALGVGALAAAGGVTSAVSQMQAENSSDGSVLSVPESAVITSEDCTLIEDYSSAMRLIGDFELPYGTLVWSSCDTMAACLLPTDGAKPLTQVGLLTFSNGVCPIVIDQAVGQNEGFEIYDVRANEHGVVWTEADILDGVWRIYSAVWDGVSLGEPALLEEGGGDWETPLLAAAGNYAWWQVLPKADGAARAEDSRLMRARFGASEADTAYVSHGRMCTPPYALSDGVVITPRAEASSVRYQLTLIDAENGEVRDHMTLPTSMRPLEAGFGNTGFSFSFDAIYNYGDGIANLGTYTPRQQTDGENASNAPWFRFPRTPSAAPAWCGNWFMVKSTRSVCGVNFADNAYFALDVPNGSDTYGDYLASTGANSVVVTYANVDHQPIDGAAIHCCNVRVWAPVA